MARAMCADGGFDPEEPMPDDGPRWRYYVPGATAAHDALWPLAMEAAAKVAERQSLHGDLPISVYEAAQKDRAAIAAAIREGAPK
jgi:hypothetical protein